MRLTCVGSGSSGNSYVLEDRGHRLILDVGMPWKEIQIACGFDVSSIDACIATHGHGDHCKYIPKVIPNGIDCYAGVKAVEPIYNSTGCAPKSISERSWTSIREWSVIAVEVHHDVPCYGYIIVTPGGERLAYFTDYSYIGANEKEKTLKTLNINHWLIAVNYTGEPDTDGAKSAHIYSGHSSLEYVKRYLSKSISDSCKSIIACHLSSSNSDEELIIEELTKLAPQCQIGIAKKGIRFDL